MPYLARHLRSALGFRYGRKSGDRPRTQIVTMRIPKVARSIFSAAYSLRAIQALSWPNFQSILYQTRSLFRGKCNTAFVLVISLCVLCVVWQSISTHLFASISLKPIFGVEVDDLFRYAHLLHISRENQGAWCSLSLWVKYPFFQSRLLQPCCPQNLFNFSSAQSLNLI
jgi:hypothetical protein